MPRTDSRLGWINSRSASIGLALFAAALIAVAPQALAVDPPAAANPSASSDQPLKVQFQQGVDGYKSTVDTEVWALAPLTILDTNPNASSDANNDGGESQVLMRFDGILGLESGRIPPGAAIVSARLHVAAFDQGTTVNLHRMLVPFDDSATWSSLVSGVSADGLEASRHKDSFTFGKIAASTSDVVFDVTDTVQAWAAGEPNHGWVFLNTGGNGWDFYTADAEQPAQRPRLVVEYLPPAAP
jgi:hypothetical protein